MHREIQIKQFPIVTTHWWPKTRTTVLWENQQYYIVFYLLYTTMSKWSECAHTSGVWRVCVTCVCVCVTCVCARALAPFTRASASTPLVDFEWSDVKRCQTELWVRRFTGAARSRSWKHLKRQRRRQPIRSPHANTQSRSCNTREVCDWLL